MAEAIDLDLTAVRLHGQRWGAVDAPLVIAVPGLTGTSEVFGRLGEAMAGAGAGLRLVALDPRGRGQSEIPPAGSYGWERHALDVLEVATALGAERCSVVGLSMGASVAMKAAELAPDRLAAVVLIDVAGRVDPGVGPVIADRLRSVPPQSSSAIAEDRVYTATQDPYARWTHLTMPTLLVRATQEMQPGSGFVVPAADVVAFRAQVPTATVVEVDADHATIVDHPATAAAIVAFVRPS